MRDGAVCIFTFTNSTFTKKLLDRAAKGSILYNVVDDSEEGITASENEVRVGVFDDKGGQATVRSSLNIDGGKAWKNVVAGNDSSFESIHLDNRDSDVGKIETARTNLHKRLKLSMD